MTKLYFIYFYFFHLSILKLHILLFLRQVGLPLEAPFDEKLIGKNHVSISPTVLVIFQIKTLKN